ncbi:MAG: prepilin-type N-terminal cleavage/methylation domain-containing protein [Candidatus Marinimicrobia bacterium]|nr:prepilin-type N-terminal cleavage/methylation domain-containing protein [Candidatus Neomarinimicrobiota bacterium]
MEAFRSSNNRSGFTLIELITGMLVISVIFSAVAGIISTSVQSMDTIDSRKNIIIDGYYASSKFVREFREINEQIDVLIADPKIARFVVDDTLVVQYELTGELLTRLIVGNAQSQMMTNCVDVANSLFRYYDVSNNELSGIFNPITVWRGRLELTMVNKGNTIYYAADVFPENFK